MVLLLIITHILAAVLGAGVYGLCVASSQEDRRREKEQQEKEGQSHDE